MKLEDINFDLLTKVEVVTKKDGSSLYKDNKFFYKLFPGWNSSSYIQDGLDLLWCRQDKIATDSVGLITKDICPALHDYIYDNGVCMGYIMHEGNILEDVEVYKLFVNKLVNHSLSVGYGIVDCNIYNIIMYEGAPSLIDINFHPIKLLHGKSFNDAEYKLWISTFSCDDGIYINKLLDAIGTPILENTKQE